MCMQIDTEQGVSMNFFLTFLLIMLHVISSQCVRKPFSANDISLSGQTLDRNPNSFSHTTLLFHDYVPSPPSLELPLPPPSSTAKRGSCRLALPPPSEVKKRRMQGRPSPPPAPNCRRPPGTPGGCS